MTRRISTAEAEQNFAAILHDVEDGETVVITNGDKDVARIDPVETEEVRTKREQAHRELLEHLRQVKAIDIGPWTRAELYEDEE